MKRKIFYGLGAIFIGALTLGAVANGPYYALPAWSQKLLCIVGNCPRFIVLSDWNSEAVLDRETGLVWEQSPRVSGFEWKDAQAYCYQRNVGSRSGWRLPTVNELASLVDLTQITPPLPAGHPFSNVDFLLPYWSATTVASDDIVNNTPFAWYVSFGTGDVLKGFRKSVAVFHAWCVRGGQGYDGQ